jgi:hypothetical protein
MQQLPARRRVSVLFSETAVWLTYGVIGHSAFECKNPRKMLFDGVQDVPAGAAWEKMKVASNERDLDDFKEGFMEYRKATPEATYAQLETAFRAQGFSVFLIAIEKELQPTYTNIDLQGNLEKKYTVTFRLSDKHQRPKEKELWPSSPEENMDRLEDAGEPFDRGVPLCSNCSALGHTSRVNCAPYLTELLELTLHRVARRRRWRMRIVR